MSERVIDLECRVPFFGHYLIEDETICDGVINYWKYCSEKFEGKIRSNKNGNCINKSVKDSIDVYIRADAEKSLPVSIERYLRSLKACTELYLKKFTFADTAISNWGITEDINIQYYPPGGGYKVWHCERTTSLPPFVNRMLVFMTYLNDVDDKDPYEGGTEWYYWNFKTKAKKGHTVLWPADWMYTHRGIVAPLKEKYIITGWYSFT